jgi:hypothetical protein
MILEAIAGSEEDLRTLTLKDCHMADVHTFVEQAD